VAGSIQHRAAMSADLVLGSQRLRVVNVHLDTRLNVTTRIEQLRPAAIDLPERAIVGGDFNTNPAAWIGNTVPVLLPVKGDSDQAPVLDDYMAALGYHCPTASFGPTAPIPVLQVRLDSIYLRGLAATAGRVERDVDVSDHWPVWVDVPLDRSPETVSAR
jgi:endonuclease/exonuclease/phosphatase family metal-dependent hydrolase